MTAEIVNMAYKIFLFALVLAVFGCMEGPAGPTGPQGPKGDSGPGVTVLSGFLDDSKLSGAGQMWVIPMPPSEEPPLASVYYRCAPSTVWRGMVEGGWRIGGDDIWIMYDESLGGCEYRIILAQVE